MPVSPPTKPTNPSRTLPGFGALEAERILAEDDLFVVAADRYPVSPGHTLVIAIRPVARFRDLREREKLRLLHWLDWTVNHLQATLRPQPDGFNIASNDGAAAGQTITQLHWHVIPRYTGDVPDPRGGVRFVIPEKAKYWPVEETSLSASDKPEARHRRQSGDVPFLRCDPAHDPAPPTT